MYGIQGIATASGRTAPGLFADSRSAVVTERLRLISANLATGKADPRAFRDLVRELRPDVVAVQELAREQAVALAEVLPFGRLDPSGGMAMGIALRRPGSVTRVSLPYRGAWATEVSLGQNSSPHELVEILNVHVVAPHVPPPWRTVARRRAQVRALVAYLDATPGRRRVVLGDLNSTPAWPAYRVLRRRLGDAAQEVARRDGHRAARTWRPSPWLPRLLRIDHVLTSGLSARAVRVLPIEGSDHAAVMADLCLD